MTIFGNPSGLVKIDQQGRQFRVHELTCQPRKRTKPTKAEKRLEKRIEGHNAALRSLGTRYVERSYTRPGSLQLS